MAPGDPGAQAAATASVSHPTQSTTHLVVADRRGTVVSYTFTIESTGGNGIVVPDHGFLLNNELTDFNIDALDHPNSAGPSKRPRSSMSPTIVTRHGRPLLAVGSPGGASIITTVAQILLERIELGATLPEAIARPRVSQRNAATSEAEAAFLATPEAAALSSAYGQPFRQAAADIGAVTALELQRRGRILAAAEPTRRGGGSAAVVDPRP